jgi:drug/metabolite transporter (DMT)-like permease
MRLRSLLTMIALGAAWGSSFLFMKIAVPDMGPFAMVEARVLIGALALSVFALALRKSLPRGRQWLPCIMIGLFYSAIPLLLWAYAARTLGASLLSIINATAPLFGVLVTLLWLRERMRARGIAGLALGFAGVALLVGGESLANSRAEALPILAAFGASLMYGVIANYQETIKDTVNPFSNALGSLWVASVALLPAVVLVPPPAMPGPPAWGAVAMLGIVCTAIAYHAYFGLIDELGPASALTVAYLIPVFGTLWGVLFLGERISVHMIAGAAMIVAGIALVASARRVAAGVA